MVFDPSVYTEFRYIAADFTAEDFSYSFRFELVSPTETHQFTERIAFTPVRPEHEVDWPRVRSIAIMLGAVVGLSYYKVAAPPRYVIALEGMTQAGVDYLQVALREGLAEYAYRNEFPGLLSPEIVLEAPLAEQWPVDQHLTPSGDPLVPIGGGKDSVVTVELLAAARMHPLQFAVNPNKIMYRVGRIKGHPVLAASRSLDPHLLELNAVGALNGHVPVTAMNSLIALVQARIIGLGPVVMSLEASASEATLVWDGHDVNHQWSKSEQAEELLQDMLGPQAGLSAGAYFSLLRPYSEVQIARYFAALPEYHPVITSCNRAFRQGVEDARWCGDCDKCRFIFLILSPFIPATSLTRMFADNLLDNQTQVEGYRALLGLHEHRPFECVGEQAESLLAFTWIAHQSDWCHSAVVKALTEEMPELSQPHPELEDQVLGERHGRISLPAPFESLGSVLA
jgi:UDP-N-acetyl-alpha-D-muramoyl-L-alanyl-L-glutamate epimerase